MIPNKPKQSSTKNVGAVLKRLRCCTAPEDAQAVVLDPRLTLGMFAMKATVVCRYICVDYRRC